MHVQFAHLAWFTQAVYALCTAKLVCHRSSRSSDSHRNLNSSVSDHLGPMKKIRAPAPTCTSRAVRAIITTCVSVSRGSVSHKECGARECHVDRAGCFAYSLTLRTMCVACSLRDKSCNFAEWMIATRAVRADPLRQHISCVWLALMNSARNLMGLSSPRMWGSLRASRSLRSSHSLRSS